ncbi:hypothetical protein Tco_0264527 [Tanacetum coccineum]
MMVEQQRGDGGDVGGERCGDDGFDGSVCVAYDGDDKDGGCGDGVRRGGCWLELAKKLAGKRGAPEI